MGAIKLIALRQPSKSLYKKGDRSTISLRLPDSLHESVRNIAKEDNISINKFVATALAEKMSALMTEKYLSEHAEKRNITKFKNIDPDTVDEL